MTKMRNLPANILVHWEEDTVTKKSIQVIHTVTGDLHRPFRPISRYSPHTEEILEAISNGQYTHWMFISDHVSCYKLLASIPDEEVE